MVLSLGYLVLSVLLCCVLLSQVWGRLSSQPKTATTIINCMIGLGIECFSRLPYSGKKSSAFISCSNYEKFVRNFRVGKTVISFGRQILIRGVSTLSSIESLSRSCSKAPYGDRKQFTKKRKFKATVMPNNIGSHCSVYTSINPSPSFSPLLSLWLFQSRSSSSSSKRRSEPYFRQFPFQLGCYA